MNWKFSHLSLLAASILSSSISFADILGDYNQTINYPGYLSLDSDHSVYYGPWEHGSKLEKKDEVERRTPSEIVDDYLAGSSVDTQAIEDLIKSIKYYKSQALIFECQQKIAEYIAKEKASSKATELYKNKGNLACQEVDLESDQDLPGLYKKFSQDSTGLAANFAIARAKQFMSEAQDLAINPILLNTASGQTIVAKFVEGLEVWQAALNEDPQRGHGKSTVSRTVEKVINTLAKHKLKAGNSQAANLEIPTELKKYYPNQIFFSPEDLEDQKTIQRLSKIGMSVSDLNPLSSGLWRQSTTPISEFDTTNYNGEGLASLATVLDADDVNKIVDPKQSIDVTYTAEKILGGASPKFDVKFKKTKFKLKFVTDKVSFPSELIPTEIPYKWMLGMEVNTEGAVNNIAAALGFSVDPTYYKKSVRVYFPKEAYESESVWQAYYDEMLRNLDVSYIGPVNPWTAFTEIKTDEDGKKYVLVKNVSLEKKSHEATDTNIGKFLKANFGKSMKRDHRAMALFLAFVADGDVKEANAKLKLVPGKNSSDIKDYKVVYSASDMGSAFGQGMPNNFSPDFVRSYSLDENGMPEEIDIRFQAIYKLDLIELMSMDDAKWLAKRLAQLTPKQIYNAFRISGGYPNVVSVYFTESFLKRRDELLEALGLMGKTIITSNGNKIQLSPLSQIEDVDDFSLVDKYETGQDLSKYIQYGLLVDPDNTLFNPEDESFARYWGSYIGLKPHNMDEKSAKELKAMIRDSVPSLAYQAIWPYIQDNVQVSTSGVELKTSDFTLMPFCGGERCFFQGANLGLQGMLPGRFIVENPFYNERIADSDRYWIVDVLRVGVFGGEKGEKAFDLLGIDLGAMKDNVFAWGQLSLGVEYVRIHAIRDYATAKQELDEKRIGLIDAIRPDKDLLNKMDAGDILITTTFAGGEGSIKYDYPIFYVVSAEAKLAAERIVLSRTITMKEENKKALITWQNVQDNNVSLSAGLALTILKAPIIASELKSVERLDRIYRFDLNNEEQLSLAAKTMKKYTPKSLPADLKVREDSLKLKQSKIAATFLGLINKFEFRNKKIEVSTDNTQGDDKNFLVYEKEQKIIDSIDFMPITRDNFLTKAVLDQNNQLFASFKFDFSLPGSNKEQVIKYFSRYESLFPPDFVAFDINTINFYVGPIKMSSELVINEAGIGELFAGENRSKMDLCRVYAQVNEIQNEMDFCSKIYDKNPFSSGGNLSMAAHGFIEKFQEAQAAYKKLRAVSSVENKRQAYRLMKKIVDLLSSGKRYRRALDVLLTFVSAQNYYREAVIDVTKLESLTGKNYEIRISDRNRGEFAPSSIYRVSNPNDYIDSMATLVIETLGSLVKAPVSF